MKKRERREREREREELKRCHSAATPSSAYMKELENVQHVYFEDIEDIVKYHYENKDYTLPYELAIGNVKL